MKRLGLDQGHKSQKAKIKHINFMISLSPAIWFKEIWIFSRGIYDSWYSQQSFKESINTWSELLKFKKDSQLKKNAKSQCHFQKEGNIFSHHKFSKWHA